MPEGAYQLPAVITQRGSPPTRANTEKDGVTRFKQLFDDAREAMQEGRKLAEASRDYFDGEQLTAAQRHILNLRKQPDVVINRTRRAVEGILGIVETSKTDPRAYMRNPASESSQTPPMPGGAPTGMAPGPGMSPSPPPAPGPGAPWPPPQMSALGAPAATGGNGIPPGMGPPGMAPPGGLPMVGHNGGPPLTPDPAQQLQGGGAPEPPDLDPSDVSSMTLRFIADTSRFQMTKMDALEAMCIEGTTAAIVNIDAKKDIPIDAISPDEYFWDPRSRKADFSDKRYDGIAKWMYADDVIADHPDKEKDIENSVIAGDAGFGGDIMWDDKPEIFGGHSWTDRRQRRLMVVELYYKIAGEGWYRCKFHGGGWLDEPAPSPYVDDDGVPMNPIEAVSGYVSRKLMRYGVVKDMIDIQDEINQRRSKAIHEINTRQIQQSDPNALPIDVDIARLEAAKPDGVIPAGWVVVNRSDVVANSIAMLQEAKSELERLSPNPAILGRQGADASGRAQQFRAQAGLTEFARFLGRFKDWENRVYKQCWSRARQFWDAPKWIRVTDEAGAPQYVQVNEFVGYGQMGQPQFKNEVARMDVDIVLDSVPDTATLEQEIWGDLVKLAESYGPQAVPFEVMIEMSPLPRKQELIKRLKKAQAEMAAANAAALQVKAAQAQADTQETQSQTAKNMATTKKTEVDTTIRAMEGHAMARALGAIPPAVTAVGEHAALLAESRPEPATP